MLQTYDGVSDDEAKQRAGGADRRREAELAACPLRAQCVRGVGGRTVALHPQERLLQAARAFQASPAFAEYRRRRLVVEQRIARLVQLGIRRAPFSAGLLNQSHDDIRGRCTGGHVDPTVNLV